MTNHVQKENYAASMKAKRKHISKPYNNLNLQASLIWSWTMLSYPLSHLAQFHNKPSAVPLVSSLWASWPPFPAAPPCFWWQWREQLVGLLHLPSGHSGEAISIAFSQNSWTIRLERAKRFRHCVGGSRCAAPFHILHLSLARLPKYTEAWICRTDEVGNRFAVPGSMHK